MMDISTTDAATTESTAVQEAAAMHPDPEVRKALVVYNSAIDEELLEKLLDDPDSDVRRLVAQHPLMADEVLAHVGYAPDSEVRRTASRIRSESRKK